MIKKSLFFGILFSVFSITGFAQTKTDTAKAKPIQHLSKVDTKATSKKKAISISNSKNKEAIHSKKLILKQSTPVKKED